jgi:hypothetical protein
MPRLLRPVFRWLDLKSPDWLRVDKAPLRKPGRGLCTTPHTKTLAPQRKGTMMRTNAAFAVSPEMSAAAARATGAHDPPLPTSVKAHGDTIQE